MRNKLTFAIAYLMFSSLAVTAQSSIDSVLKTVAGNNKTLLANKQLLEAKNLHYKTGIYPSNPSVEYDYLKGTPSNAGDQHDFLVVQAFDFPTTYHRKNQLAREQTLQSENEAVSLRQDILLDAKKICIRLVYHQKMQTRLLQRKNQTESLLRDFQKKLDTGDGNILDVNKAKLQLISISKELQNNSSSITQLNQKLMELNGGVAISFNDSVYAFTEQLPPFESLEKEYELNDPLRKLLEQDRTISQKQLEVSRSLSLPKMELGYHYQGILGQDFNGIHTGITIPLWENKNTVKQKQAEMVFADLSLSAHLNEHYYHLQHTYEKYLNLRGILKSYDEALQNINSPALLSKALDLGHLSTIEYFMEMNYFYEAYNGYLDSEMEYQEVIAELLKYQL